MADREIREVHYNEGGGGGSGAMGFLGIILGALLVIGGIFFFVSNWDGAPSSGSPQVTINTPSVPTTPSAPSTTGSGAAK